MSRPTASVPRMNFQLPPLSQTGGFSTRIAELLVRRMRRDETGEGGEEDEEADEPEPDHRAAVLAKIAPELDEAARPLDLPDVRAFAGREIGHLTSHAGCAD